MEPVSTATDSQPPGELYCSSCEKTFHTGERCPTDGTRLLKLKARIDPFLGRDLDGRYTVREKLGSGGMGAVYRAQQHSVDREVAIKVVNSSLVSEPEVIKRFLREAKLASRLSHPNAVGVLDFGQTDDGVFYLVMELVHGRTLDDEIRAERAFKPERIVRIAIQICDALEGAHQLSIIHRDLKPANIMLMASGRDLVKVLDFGLAKSMSPDQTSTTMTSAGSVVGTPAFMPPELATGEPCDGRSDLYSLGVILYLMGSGRLPFLSESVHELLALHASEDPAPPMTGVPARLAAVIDKLLCKRPADRFQSAAEARTALEEALVIGTPLPTSTAPMSVTPSRRSDPAMSAQHANFQTPVPPSLVDERSARQRPGGAAAARLMTEETMLAASGHAVAAASQAGLASESAREAPRTSRWPLVAGAGAVALLAVVGIAISLRGGDPRTAPATAPAAGSATPARDLTVTTPDSTTRTPSPAVETPEPTPPASKPPEPTPPQPTPPASKPPASKPPAIKTAKPPRGTTPARGTAAGSAQVKTTPPTPPASGATTKPPANTGSGTKPPALPF